VVGNQQKTSTAEKLQAEAPLGENGFKGGTIVRKKIRGPLLREFRRGRGRKSNECLRNLASQEGT